MLTNFLKVLVRKIISCRWVRILLPTFALAMATFNTIFGGKFAPVYWFIVSIYWTFVLFDWIF